MNNQHVACFTGHRRIAKEGVPELTKTLEEVIKSLIKQGVVASFLSQDDDNVSKAFIESASKNISNEKYHYKGVLASKKFEGRCVFD